MGAFQGSIAVCKDASTELKPFLSVLSDVHGPGDLLQKLKKNVLDGDEGIFEAFDGAGRYCTFRQPNGMECGKCIGRPVRIILLGPDEDLTMTLESLVV